jgi:hypothetical protein
MPNATPAGAHVDRKALGFTSGLERRRDDSALYTHGRQAICEMPFDAGRGARFEFSAEVGNALAATVVALTTGDLPTKLTAALEGTGATVSGVRVVQKVELSAPSDGARTRYNVARSLVGTLGQEVLSDEIEFTLNGTPLSSEIVDTACAPRVVQLV